MSYDGRILADARSLPIANESVQCVVTSPPYFGLRDYGHAGQIGLEATPSDFVDAMVSVFAEVWRVLRNDGTLWLNLGDSYAGSWGSQGREGHVDMTSRSILSQRQIAASARKKSGTGSVKNLAGLKPKDLMGIPWRVAFALQAEGWYLRSDIVWAKPNPMPESIQDRPTRSHEYIFLLTKSERYFYDMHAIKEPVNGTAHRRASMKTPDGWDTSTGKVGHGKFHKSGREKGVTPKSQPAGSGIKANDSFQAAVTDLVSFRNKRDVWTVGTHAYPEAHYATFPPALIEPCILAGSRPGDYVLDPFAGSGTVAMVAERYGRRWLSVDLGYQGLQSKRMENLQYEIVGNHV